MAKKPGLTFERHQQVAAELKDIRRRLLALSVEIGNAYPRSGKKGWPGKALSRALKQVDSARCWAEENMFSEYPEAGLDIYYGGE